MTGCRGLMVVCLVGCFVVAGLTFAADTPEDAAQAAAESWLALVDGGDYVIIQYDAAFESKASTVETLTAMADPDGAWRVSGYLIR